MSRNLGKRKVFTSVAAARKHLDALHAQRSASVPPARFSREVEALIADFTSALTRVIDNAVRDRDRAIDRALDDFRTRSRRS